MACHDSACSCMHCYLSMAMHGALGTGTGGPVSLDRAVAALDVLCMVPQPTTASSLGDALRAAIRKQLRAMQVVMVAEERVCDVRALHFQPPGWPHAVTIVYPLHSGSGKASP
jgi:hypothetical protein